MGLFWGYVVAAHPLSMATILGQHSTFMGFSTAVPHGWVCS